jgi:hypothetical protein
MYLLTRVILLGYVLDAFADPANLIFRLDCTDFYSVQQTPFPCRGYGRFECLVSRITGQVIWVNFHLSDNGVYQALLPHSQNAGCSYIQKRADISVKNAKVAA